jgi:hypothetical protein
MPGLGHARGRRVLRAAGEAAADGPKEQGKVEDDKIGHHTGANMNAECCVDVDVVCRPD